VSESEKSDKLLGLLESLGQPRLEYAVNMARWPDAMRRSFVELGPDAALVEYLERVLRQRASRGRTLLQRTLRLAMSDFNANALLHMYPMHLFGTGQAEQLLGRSRRGSLLDIGAGSGDVTAVLQPLFDRVEVIETAWAARRRLAARGYVCHAGDVAETGILGDGYDVITLLNVLDRADRPVTLLERCHSKLTPESRLLVSIPLPYRPHVYAGVTSREPRERLPVVGSQFSDALLRLVQNALCPAGFTVERFTRLPYLSGGDSDFAMTVLDAAVLVLRKSG
jgi:SAM-dependent methyltransferase